MGWSRDIEAIILLSWGGADWPDYMERVVSAKRVDFWITITCAELIQLTGAKFIKIENAQQWNI